MANTVSASADPVPRQPQKEAEHMDRRPKAAQGFEAAFDAYGPMVYRLAMVYLGSKADAEDVSQEAFIRLLYKSPKFADGEHEKRWLLRVAVNLCRDQLKGFWRRRAVELEPGIPEGASGVKQVDIGGGVTAQYVRVEGFWSVANGLLQDGKYHEDTDSRLRHYYDLIDGQLVEVGTDAREAAVQLTWNGVERSARFRWFVYNGTLHYTEETEMRMSGESDLALVIQAIGSRTDKLMLTAADVGLGLTISYRR